jgi:hypothetical protein
LKERYLDFFHKGASVFFLWSAGQTGFYGTIWKISGRNIRDRDKKKFVPQVSTDSIKIEFIQFGK